MDWCAVLAAGPSVTRSMMPKAIHGDTLGLRRAVMTFTVGVSMGKTSSAASGAALALVALMVMCIGNGTT